MILKLYIVVSEIVIQCMLHMLCVAYGLNHILSIHEMYVHHVDSLKMIRQIDLKKIWAYYFFIDL